MKNEVIMGGNYDPTKFESVPVESAPSSGSEKIIASIERIEALADTEPMEPETLVLLHLAKEAQRTGKMPDLSCLPNTGYTNRETASERAGE